MKSVDFGQAYAGETRHYLDWFYGINLSRALMNAIKKAGSFHIFSIGRVQGPALALIVNKEKKIKRPQYETEEFFMTTAWGETTDEAAKIALRDMIDWLVQEKNLTKEEAYALCSCTVDLRVSQFVDITPGVRAVLPKNIFI